MFFVSLLLYIISLLILYKVIETAVKNGINRSRIGALLEEKYGLKEPKKTSFLDDDLDND